VSRLISVWEATLKVIRVSGKGDPLSPLLFNLAADCLAKMVQTTQNNGLIKGLIHDVIPNGVAILQYADDTILCMEDSAATAQNMKILLYIYKKMSGLKINFNKSEIIMVSSDEQKALVFSDMLNCATGTWPIKYLGVPVSGSRLHIIDWLNLNEKIMKRLDGWQCTSLSYGGKLILLNACLSSIPTYAMSMYMLPKQ
jgi:mannosylglycoprotein endo-beta-mannosidase